MGHFAATATVFLFCLFLKEMYIKTKFQTIPFKVIHVQRYFVLEVQMLLLHSDVEVTTVASL